MNKNELINLRKTLFEIKIFYTIKLYVSLKKVII